MGVIHVLISISSYCLLLRLLCHYHCSHMILITVVNLFEPQLPCDEAGAPCPLQVALLTGGWPVWERARGPCSRGSLPSRPPSPRAVVLRS